LAQIFMKWKTMAAAIALAGLLFSAWHVRSLPESYPMGDTATTSLYVLRASSGTLSTGAYSRFGWHHPGPLLYQVLSPAYRWSGYREASLKWAMTAINVVCLALLLVAGTRLSPRLTACLVLALTPLIWHEQRLIFWSWNPVAAVIPLTAALLLTGGVAAGALNLLPALGLLLSLIAQAHLGFAPIALALGLVALVGATVFDPAREWAALGKWTALSAAITSAVWFIPLAFGSHNLRDILAFWLQPHAPQPWTEVINTVAVELSVPFAWSRELITGDHVTAHPWQLAWAVLFYPLLSLSAFSALRRGDRAEGWFAVSCLVGASAAPLLIRSIVGEVHEYLVFWLGIVAISGTAAILATAIRPLLRTSRTRSQWLTPVLAGWLCAAVVLTASRIDYKQRADSSDHTTFHLAEALEKFMATHGADPPVLSFRQRVWFVGTGLVLQVTKRGLPIRVADDQLFLVGEEFRSTGTNAIELHLMALDEELPPGTTAHEWLATVAEYRLIRIWRSPGR
jgi:hypothetical protein